MHLSKEQIEAYRAGWRQRDAQRQQQRLQRQQLGWEVARQGAQILKDRFGAGRVWLFGSLLQTQWVHGESDVDLAAEGLEMDRYLEAVGCLLDLSSEFLVDLVPLEQASETLRQVIEQQGVEV